jgi:hypothetical protein
MSEPPNVQRPQPPDEEPIEGGVITNLGDEPLSFHEAKHRADTARRLAYWLVMVLGGSFAAHYLTVLTLEIFGKREAAESLSKLFASWLPVISSFVGSAITYYFTHEKR